MANGFYTIGKVDSLNGNVTWAGGTSLAVHMLNTGYTFNGGDTDFATSCSAHEIGAPGMSLSGMTDGSTGVIGNSVVFTGISSGLTVKSIVVVKDDLTGGGELLLYYDTGTGFPLTTTGANITIDWNATPTSGLMFSL